LHKNTAAVAAVATVRTAALDIFLTAKTHTTVSTVTRLDHYFCFVYKFHVVRLELLVLEK
jgi:hypothetical protein